MTMRHVLGTGLGFAGVVVLVGEPVFGGVGDSPMAQAALLGAAISYAFSAVFGRRFRGMRVAPMQIATGQVTAAAVLLLPLEVLVDRPWQLPPPGSITLLAVLGENLQERHLLGLVLIIAGLMVIDGRVAAFRRDRN